MSEGSFSTLQANRRPLHLENQTDWIVYISEPRDGQRRNNAIPSSYSLNLGKPRPVQLIAASCDCQVVIESWTRTSNKCTLPRGALPLSPTR